jgi:hypothetical protein
MTEQSTNNLGVWKQFADPPEWALGKPLPEGGGTPVKALWMIRCATELWGRAGSGWGWEAGPAQFDEQSGFCRVLARVWVESRDQAIEEEAQWPIWQKSKYAKAGETPYSHPVINGWKRDENAAMKCRTHAISKALSRFGIASTIYMGYDDRWEQDRDQDGGGNGAAKPAASAGNGGNGKTKPAANPDAAERSRLQSVIRAAQANLNLSNEEMRQFSAEVLGGASTKTMALDALARVPVQLRDWAEQREPAAAGTEAPF